MLFREIETKGISHKKKTKKKMIYSIRRFDEMGVWVGRTIQQIKTICEIGYFG